MSNIQFFHQNLKKQIAAPSPAIFVLFLVCILLSNIIEIFQAVLPETNIKNFTSDWSNGINLSALLDYCQPGLMPNWRNLNPNDGPNNCQRAMEVAEKHFKIPMVSVNYMLSVLIRCGLNWELFKINVLDFFRLYLLLLINFVKLLVRRQYYIN